MWVYSMGRGREVRSATGGVGGAGKSGQPLEDGEGGQDTVEVGPWAQDNVLGWHV